MSPDAQRIAFAEACGWSRLAEPKWVEYFWRPGALTGANAHWENAKGQPMLHKWIPDYTSDLNAMREALMSLKLTTEQKRQYGITLLDIVERDGADPTRFNHVTSSAAQQLEAILRTLGKWEEGK